MNALVSVRPKPAADYDLSTADFDRVRRLILQRAGISLHAGKQAMVQGRLSRRVRNTEHTSISEYLRWLDTLHGPDTAGEWQAFVNCLTTNLTAFFREAHHFPLLAEALHAHHGARTGSTPMRIWCA